MSDDFIRATGLAMTKQIYPMGEIVLYVGQRIKHLYIIRNGSVSVRHEGKIISNLMNGDYFGRIPLEKGSGHDIRSKFSSLLIQTLEWYINYFNLFFHNWELFFFWGGRGP
jgi:CRP-like cAMP-binding protein